MRQIVSGFSFLVLSALVALVASSAQATVIHSDVTADTVVYTNISEGSPTGDPEPLYDQPTASGDVLVFSTTSDFSAESIDGAASDQTDGKLSFIMQAKAGHTLESFSFSEDGLVALDSPFGGDAFAKVVGFASVTVLEINGSPVSLPAINAFMNASPMGGQYQLSTIGGTSFTAGWSGSLTVPMPQGTTKALVTLNNNLFAASMGPGSRAIISKSAFGLDVDTAVIPEPASVVLLLGAIALSGLGRRRLLS